MNTIKSLFLVGAIGISSLVDAQVSVSPSFANMDAIRTDESNTVGQKIKINPVTENSLGTLRDNRGITTWQFSVEAENCDGIIVYFDELVLPQGSEIFAMSNDSSLKTRLFTKNENREVKTFALPVIYSNKVIVKASIPTKVANDFSAVISEIGCIVKKGGNNTDGFGDADPCFINVNCPDGQAWQDQKRAVAQYTYTSGSEIGNCTGTLLNTTAQDNRNLFLSAHHCAIEATDEELGQAIFYFNYEALDCENPSSSAGLLDDAIVGCTRIAASGGMHQLPPDGSDFHLFELNPIPASFNVYYSGWNRYDLGANIPMPGAIIQHPLSDIKKISFIESFEQASSYSDFYADCVQSSGTGGIVEPNSSGSAVFDNDKCVIGTVSYGTTGCVIPGEWNFAAGGRFQKHWDQNGAAANRQLKPWLDPLNTGVMTLDGTNVIVGIEQISDESGYFQVYPNPATTNISIVCEAIQPSQSLVIIILDIYGRPLIKKQCTGLPYNLLVSDLENGLYIVSLQTGSNTYCKAFIKH
jgi:hypothetical protein